MGRSVVFCWLATCPALAVAACDQIAGVRDLTLAGPVSDAAADLQLPPPPSEDAAESGPWTLTTAGSPAHLAIDDAYLYWITYPVGGAGGTIMRVPLDGSVSAETVATGQRIPNGFAVDDTYIYVTSGQTFTDGQIKRIKKDGSEEITIATALAAPLGITADDASVYWVDLGDGGTNGGLTGRVVRAMKDGGAPQDLIGNLVIPLGITFDDSAIYYTTSGASECDGGPTRPSGTVERIARDGGGHMILADSQDCPGQVVVHDTRVFWTNASSGHGTVNVVPKQGGTPTILASAQPLPTAIAADSTHVYWVNSQAVGGTVLTCTVADCTKSLVVLADGEVAPIALVTGKSSLFWADLGVPSRQPGTITRRPLLGPP